MLVRLPNGTRVVIRAIRPDDKALLSAGVLRLSPDSQRSRFLTAKPALSSSELRYLTEVDGEQHVALVAVLPEHPFHLVAVARYVRLTEDPDTAEIAIVVGDQFQRQGLGTRLGGLLADDARARGIRRFSASMLSDNMAAHRLFAHISRRLSTERLAGIDEVIADLAA